MQRITEVPLSDGSPLKEGDEIRVDGKTGARFTFHALVITEKAVWVDCYGGTSRKKGSRSFRPEVVLVDRRSKSLHIDPEAILTSGVGVQD